MLGFKALSKLNQKKYRQEFGEFIVEGKRAVLDAVNSKLTVTQLIVTKDITQTQSIYCQTPAIDKFFAKNQVLTLNQAEFKQLTETVTPQGIAALVKLPTTKLEELFTKKLLVILEDIRDPGNLGTMLRTADWFGVDGVILVGGADPYQSKVVRASMGSIFHLPIVSIHDLTAEIGQLKANGWSILVTRPETKSDTDLSKNNKLCIAFGNEAHGTSEVLDSLADGTLTINKYGQAESLNVAVSFGILINEVKQKQN